MNIKDKINLFKEIKEKLDILSDGNDYSIEIFNDKIRIEYTWNEYWSYGGQEEHNEFIEISFSNLFNSTPQELREYHLAFLEN